MRTLRALFISMAVIAVAAATVFFSISQRGLTQTDVHAVIIDTITGEEQQQFLVTGTLSFTTQVIQSSEKALLPGVLNLSLGTTSATVRASGRAAYGIDLGRFDIDRIQLNGDTVIVYVPPLEVFTVEPDLESLEQRVDVGWARLYRASGQEQSLAALRRLQPAMRARALQFLDSETFPMERSAIALERMLRPPLAAAGLDSPIFDFRPTPEVVRAPAN